MEAVCPYKKNRKPYQKDTFLFIEKCFEDVRLDEKHVLDLLEAIIQPPGLVKEELRHKLFKMGQFGSKIKKDQGFNILDSGNPKCSRRRPMPAFSPVGFKQQRPPQTRIIPQNVGF